MTPNGSWFNKSTSCSADISTPTIPTCCGTIPLFQTLADVSPTPEQPLASGSTVSRFKYAYTRRQRQLPVEERTIDEECQAAKCQRIAAINQFLVETFVKTRREKPTRIIIDLDASDDPAHGQQQLTFWHGYFDQQQYFPLLAFDGESGFPLGAWLRPGKAHASWGAVEALQGIVPALRAPGPTSKSWFAAMPATAFPNCTNTSKKTA